MGAVYRAAHRCVYGASAMNIRSLTRLDKAHPDLRRLMIEAAKKCPVDFEISEVLRTKARQAELKDAGASQTMRSRHLAHPSDGLSRAADIYCTVGDKVRWDWPLYIKAAAHIKATATRLGIAITWGGDWKSLRDGPHFELNWKAYP